MARIPVPRRSPSSTRSSASFDRQGGVRLRVSRHVRRRSGDPPRRAARVGAEHKVYKNTLAILAVREAGFDVLEPLLVGPTSLTFAADRLRCGRQGAARWSRTNPLLVLKGGALGTTPAQCRRRQGARRPAVPRTAARKVCRSAAGAAGQDRRPAAGAAAQLRLWPLGPHRNQEAA